MRRAGHEEEKPGATQIDPQSNKAPTPEAEPRTIVADSGEMHGMVGKDAGGRRELRFRDEQPCGTSARWRKRRARLVFEHCRNAFRFEKGLGKASLQGILIGSKQLHV